VPLAPGQALDELLKMKEAGTIGHVGLALADDTMLRIMVDKQARQGAS